MELFLLHKIFNWLISGECESSRGTVRTQCQQLRLALCTSLATFACGWWYLCRTNGCWWAEMVDSPRSFIYSPLMRSRQLDLRRCHMGRSCGGQAWYTVASQAFFQAFPWKKSVPPMDGNLDASFCRGRARWPSQPSCKPSALSALKLGNHGFVCHHPNVLCTTFDLSQPMRLVAWRFSHLFHQQFEVYWRKIRSSVRHETGGWPWTHFVMAQ